MPTSPPVMRAFPLIDIAGEPRERGLQYGQGARDQIRIGIGNYQQAFLKIGISWDEALAFAATFITRLSAEEPRLLEEIRGIAQGAGVRFEEILALNARTEILYHARSRNVMGDGCTGAVVLPEASASHRLLHAQNWDWRDECAESTVILRVSPDSGPKMLIQAEAGVLARCGLNSQGIGLTGNFLKCERENVPGGLPIPFIRRRILMAGTFRDAIAAIYRSPRSFSSNIMLSCDAGEAFDFEATPGEVFWTEPQDGLLVHANHFVSTAARCKVRDVGIEVAPDSLYRHRRVASSLYAKRGHITFAELREALADRVGDPHGVCSGPDAGPGGDNSSTVSTILMDLAERRMSVAVRPYGEHVFTDYRL